MKSEDNLSYPLVKQILRYKKTNIGIFILYVLISVILAFFVFKKEYTSEVSIIPSAASFAAGGIASKLGGLGKLAGLDLGGQSAQSQEMYMGIITSRRLLEKLIFNEFTIHFEGDSITNNLIGFLEIEGESNREIVEKALKAMREEVIFMDIDGDNNILYLSVTTPFPELSAELANYMTSELNKIVKNEVQKEYRLQLSYLNKKITEVKDTLAIAENDFKIFLEKNTDPSTPKFQMQQLRLMRNIEVNTAIFIELKKQLEIFVVENMINLSDIKILDKAQIPFRKSRPKRALLLVTFTMLAFFIHVGTIAFYMMYKNIAFRLKSN